MTSIIIPRWRETMGKECERREIHTGRRWLKPRLLLRAELPPPAPKPWRPRDVRARLTFGGRTRIQALPCGENSLYDMIIGVTRAFSIMSKRYYFPTASTGKSIILKNLDRNKVLFMFSGRSYFFIFCTVNSRVSFMSILIRLKIIVF